MDRRLMAFLTVMAMAGCATQPAPPSPPPASQVQPTSAAVGVVPQQPAPDVEAQRLAAARSLNLKVVNKDGKQVFCRFNDVTTSHIPRDPVCYTAEQLEAMQQRTQRDLDQLTNKPNTIKGLP
jgi:hypothetical protein